MSKTKKTVCALLFFPIVFMFAFQMYVERDIEKNIVNPVKKAKQKRWDIDKVILQLELVKAYFEREDLKMATMLHYYVEKHLGRYKKLKKESDKLKKGCGRHCIWDARKKFSHDFEVARLELELELWKEVEHMEWIDKMRLKYRPYNDFLVLGYLLAIVLVIVSIITISISLSEAKYSRQIVERMKEEEEMRKQGKAEGRKAAKVLEARENDDSDMLLLILADGTQVILHEDEEDSDRFAAREVLLKDAREKQQAQLAEQEQELQQELAEKEAELKTKESGEEEPTNEPT